tara:strand:+ start:343 stop:729 length:387 start_codon:yes stop_codon:yes gene_type:complete
MTKNIEYLEKVLILLIIGCTLIAIGIEFISMLNKFSIDLADILLLFIYLEILAMCRNFIKYNEIRMSYPLLIAMTALARTIIMQKDLTDASTYVYEAVAILIIAIAIIVLRVRHLDILNRNISKKIDE